MEKGNLKESCLRYSGLSHTVTAICWRQNRRAENLWKHPELHQVYCRSPLKAGAGNRAERGLLRHKHREGLETNVNTPQQRELPWLRKPVVKP